VQLAVLSGLNKSTVSSLVDKLLAQKMIHETEANLTTAIAADKGNVIILAPNDGTARAIADAFAADKDVKSYLVTGQDAEKPPSSTSSTASNP
jgi:ABC-type xylose transport system substrate-binding protein